MASFETDYTGMLGQPKYKKKKYNKCIELVFHYTDINTLKGGEVRRRGRERSRRRGE